MVSNIVNTATTVTCVVPLRDPVAADVTIRLFIQVAPLVRPPALPLSRRGAVAFAVVVVNSLLVVIGRSIVALRLLGEEKENALPVTKRFAPASLKWYTA